jgi:3-oxoacyl-[acyl-carrier protein] reductase
VSSSRDLLGLAGKVALVTGGGAGIGRATVELYADAGMTVVVAEIDPVRAAGIRAVAEASGGMAIAADVRRAEDVDRVMADIQQRFGRLDVLVNNVGDFLGYRGEFVDSTEGEWSDLYDVNLLQIFRVTKAAIPLMRQHGGSIISLSTIEAFRGIPRAVVYSAFNAAITGFTQSLAVELGQYGIRVNAIAPETTDSEQVVATARVPAANRDHLRRWFPVGRFGAPADSAGAALFLASDKLAGWVSGSTILVDGGALAAGAYHRMADDRWTHLPIIVADAYDAAPIDGAMGVLPTAASRPGSPT